jgi:hypothetical protein
VTPVAFPAPVFETVIVYPIVVPGVTLAESAVLVIDRFGQLTVIETLLDEPVPAFELLKEAWFVTVPQVAEVVGDVMCTVAEPPEPMEDAGHASVPETIVQAPDQPD